MPDVANMTEINYYWFFLNLWEGKINAPFKKIEFSGYDFMVQTLKG